jgi:hypothetical protein
MASPVVKDCNGTILTGSGDVVCYTGYAPVLTSIEHVEAPPSLFSNYSYTEMVDGTVIRLFYHSGEWRVATRNHTNAGKCKWNSKNSFRELWNECLSEYPDFTTDLLDTSMTYMFVIQHPENEQIIPVNTRAIYLIDVYDNTTLTRMDYEFVGDTLSSIFLRPKNFQFKSTRDLAVFLSLDDVTIKGVVLHPNIEAIEDDTIYYILTSAYTSAMNDYVIKEDVNMFRNRSQTPIYTPYKNKHLEHNTNFNVGLIYEIYMNKFVNRKSVSTTPEHDRFLNPIHSYYRRNDRRLFNEGRCIINRYTVENLMYVIDETFGRCILPDVKLVY